MACPVTTRGKACQRSQATIEQAAGLVLAAVLLPSRRKFARVALDEVDAVVGHARVAPGRDERHEEEEKGQGEEDRGRDPEHPPPRGDPFHVSGEPTPRLALVQQRAWRSLVEKPLPSLSGQRTGFLD